MAEMVARLSKVFGGSAESWLVQHAQYDLAHACTERIKLERLEFTEAPPSSRTRVDGLQFGRVCHPHEGHTQKAGCGGF
jgi:hypothetical protein